MNVYSLGTALHQGQTGQLRVWAVGQKGSWTGRQHQGFRPVLRQEDQQVAGPLGGLEVQSRAFGGFVGAGPRTGGPLGSLSSLVTGWGSVRAFYMAEKERGKDIVVGRASTLRSFMACIGVPSHPTASCYFGHSIYCISLPFLSLFSHCSISIPDITPPSPINRPD